LAHSGEKLESVIFWGDEDDTGESWQFCSKVFFEIFNALLKYRKKIIILGFESHSGFETHLRIFLSRNHFWSSSILKDSRLFLRASTLELSFFSDLFYFRIKKSLRLWEISENMFMSRNHSWSYWILKNSRLFLRASTLELSSFSDMFYFSIQKSFRLYETSSNIFKSWNHSWSSSILKDSRLFLRASTLELSSFSDFFHFRIKITYGPHDTSEISLMSRNYSWSSILLKDFRLFLRALTPELSSFSDLFGFRNKKSLRL
jgi:hypothetical protein